MIGKKTTKLQKKWVQRRNNVQDKNSARYIETYSNNCPSTTQTNKIKVRRRNKGISCQLIRQCTYNPLLYTLKEYRHLNINQCQSGISQGIQCAPCLADHAVSTPTVFSVSKCSMIDDPICNADTKLVEKESTLNLFPERQFVDCYVQTDATTEKKDINLDKAQEYASIYVQTELPNDSLLVANDQNSNQLNSVEQNYSSHGSSNIQVYPISSKDILTLSTHLNLKLDSDKPKDYRAKRQNKQKLVSNHSWPLSRKQNITDSQAKNSGSTTKLKKSHSETVADKLRRVTAVLKVVNGEIDFGKSIDSYILEFEEYDRQVQSYKCLSLESSISAQIESSSRDDPNKEICLLDNQQSSFNEIYSPTFYNIQQQIQNDKENKENLILNSNIRDNEERINEITQLNSNPLWTELLQLNDDPIQPKQPSLSDSIYTERTLQLKPNESCNNNVTSLYLPTNNISTYENCLGNFNPISSNVKPIIAYPENFSSRSISDENFLRTSCQQNNAFTTSTSVMTSHSIMQSMKEPFLLCDKLNTLDYSEAKLNIGSYQGYVEQPNELLSLLQPTMPGQAANNHLLISPQKRQHHGVCIYSAANSVKYQNPPTHILKQNKTMINNQMRNFLYELNPANNVENVLSTNNRLQHEPYHDLFRQHQNNLIGSSFASCQLGKHKTNKLEMDVSPENMDSGLGTDDEQFYNFNESLPLKDTNFNANKQADIIANGYPNHASQYPHIIQSPVLANMPLNNSFKPMRETRDRKITSIVYMSKDLGGTQISDVIRRQYRVVTRELSSNKPPLIYTNRCCFLLWNFDSDRRDWNWWYVQVSLLKRKLKSFLIILSSLINAKLAYNNKLRITNLCSKSGAIADIIHFTDIGAMTYFVLSHLQMNNECSDIPSIFSLTNTEKSEHTLNINDSNNNFYIKEENDSRFLPTVDHFNQKSPNNATISVNKWGAFEDDGSMQLRRKQTVENVELDSLISNEYNSFDNYLSDL